MRGPTAARRPTTASSSDTGRAAAFATDALSSTRWAVSRADRPRADSWLAVDLGAPTAIGQVTIDWEASAGRAYVVQTSDDASTSTTRALLPTHAPELGLGGHRRPCRLARARVSNPIEGGWQHACSPCRPGPRRGAPAWSSRACPTCVPPTCPARRGSSRCRPAPEPPASLRPWPVVSQRREPHRQRRRHGRRPSRRRGTALLRGHAGGHGLGLGPQTLPSRECGCRPRSPGHGVRGRRRPRPHGAGGQRRRRGHRAPARDRRPGGGGVRQRAAPTRHGRARPHHDHPRVRCRPPGRRPRHDPADVSHVAPAADDDLARGGRGR